MGLNKQITEALDAVDESAITIENHNNPAEIVGAVAAIAPLLIILLRAVQVFTGERADLKIDKAITALQLISIIK